MESGRSRSAIIQSNRDCSALIWINAKDRLTTLEGDHWLAFSGNLVKGANVTETRKVAVVDDAHTVRDPLRLLLEIIGYAVETFASAAEFRPLKFDICLA
jgi:hypothetical protein